ncbi:unnamed protein product [Auanema sp. JU1783]|nr:unnamed protein product [Auanema sp. JU1783]
MSLLLHGSHDSQTINDISEHSTLPSVQNILLDLNWLTAKMSSAAIPIVKVRGCENGSIPEDSSLGLRRTPLDASHTPKMLKVLDGSMLRNISATDLVQELSDPVTVSKTIDAPTSLPETRVLVLYTGGTIGMMNKDGVYKPYAGYLPEVLRDIPPLNDRNFINEHYGNVATVRPYSLPPVRGMTKRVVYWIVEYEPLLDSCDMTFDDWIRIASDIKKAYHNYDGFVVLHGTDTLAYTASALSFMMENLGKPVVITGSQIPVAEVRSDGMDNLIGALVVAGNLDIPEVCVYFNNKLMRGNRTIKLDNSALEAFESPNLPPLARMNINIKVNYDSVFRSDTIEAFSVHDNLCRNVGILRIFPSISIELVQSFLAPPVKGVILQTYGCGNVPSQRKDILNAIKEAIDERGLLVLNCSQCLRGQVDLNYATGKVLTDIGVISGSDMTSEAAMTKMCYVLGKDEWPLAKKKLMLQTNLRGEMTVSNMEPMRESDIIPYIAKCLRLSSTNEIQLLRDTILPPLFCNAAKTNKPELLKSLNESGVNFSSPDYNLRTALHVAASHGNIDAVKYLLSIGVNVHTKDMFGYNPLVCAVKAKALPCVHVLRKAGASIDATTHKIGVELCLAASQGDLTLLKCYRAAGCTMKECDYDGRTALHVAVTHNRKDIVQYLMECGLDPRVMDEFGTTPYTEANRKKNTEMVDMLRHLQERHLHDLSDFDDLSHEE